MQCIILDVKDSVFGEATTIVPSTVIYTHYLSHFLKEYKGNSSNVCVLASFTVVTVRNGHVLRRKRNTTFGETKW